MLLCLSALTKLSPLPRQPRHNEWYVLSQSTSNPSVGGEGDEREKQEVTLSIELPFIESKQQQCSAYLCLKTLGGFSELDY